MRKQNTLKIFSSIIICAFFLILAYGSDKKNNNNTTTNTTNSENASSSEQAPAEENVCSKCNGLGVVNTYSYDGCHDVSHFAVSDCGSDHHTSECTSSGEKTCPCCNGTGKSQ